MCAIEARNTVASFITRSTNYVTVMAALRIERMIAQPPTTQFARSAAPRPWRANTNANPSVHGVAMIILQAIKSAACVFKPHTF